MSVLVQQHDQLVRTGTRAHRPVQNSRPTPGRLATEATNAREVGVSAQIVAATTRVSVLGPRGRVDLTVPHGTDVATVAAAYARSVGD